MSFVDAVNSCFRQYVGFSGRASRSEFWWFLLFGLLVGLAAAIVDQRGTIGALISLVLFLPSLAVGVRRLHDAGHSGWWLLIGLVPIAGLVVLIIFFVSRGDPGANRYGPPPTATGAPAYAGTFGGAPQPPLPPAPPAQDRIACPRCGESIAASALVCRFCNHELGSRESP
jgi:uncharacterized membrane protein YhaH (DUF805 family)